MLHFFAIYSPVSASYSLTSASCFERIEFAGIELLKLGVEITEDTDLILTEEYYQRGELLCYSFIITFEISRQNNNSEVENRNNFTCIDESDFTYCGYSVKIII